MDQFRQDQNKLIIDLAKKRNDELIRKIIFALQFHGFDVNEENFLSVVEGRLTKVNVSDNQVQVWIDYQTINQKFLVSYSDKVEIKQEGNKFIATIG